MAHLRTHTRPPRTIGDLISAFGGNAALARLMELTPSAVSEWRRSGNIKVVYWPKIIEAARTEGIPGVNEAVLMKMCLAAEAA